MPLEKTRPLITGILVQSGRGPTVLPILQKRINGKSLTKTEESNLLRFEREAQRELRQLIYASVPHGEYCDLAGRQSKLVYDQVEKFKVPCDEKDVDLAVVLKWFHDFLRDRGKETPAGEESAPDAIKRRQIALAEMAEMDVERARGKWMLREQVHDSLGIYGRIVKNAGEELQRRYGPDAQAILDEYIQRAIEAVKLGAAGGNGHVTPG